MNKKLYINLNKNDDFPSSLKPLSVLKFNDDRDDPNTVAMALFRSFFIEIKGFKI